MITLLFVVMLTAISSRFVVMRDLIIYKGGHSTATPT